MFTDPKVYNPDNLSKRGFISFYYNGERFRYYTGNAIGKSYFPNNAKSHKERERLLKRLLVDFTNALEKGWIPGAEETSRESQQLLQPDKVAVSAPILPELLGKILAETSGGSYSKSYVRDFKLVIHSFNSFVTANTSIQYADDVMPHHIERFLQQFSSSGTYYQTKRRTLAAVFSKALAQGYCKTNPVVASSKRKAKAVINVAYDQDQLKPLLEYLKSTYPKLHLCALLVYGTLLRPHREVRLLRRRHFNSDFSQYVLSGEENKSGRIRTLPVPVFVRNELQRNMSNLAPNDYFFSGDNSAYNDYYFNTLWSRAKPGLFEKKLIRDHQTLYSFRHAAAVNVFNKTQDLKLLQELLGHANINTTLIYLRSLGVIKVQMGMMPEL